MSKVIKTELDSAGATTSLLEADIEDSQKLVQQLSNFYNDKELVGLDYDQARAKTKSYIDVIAVLQSIAKNLGNGISESSKQFGVFMGEFDMLDDADIEDVKQAYNRASANYNAMSQMIYNLKNSDSLDLVKTSKLLRYYNAAMQTYYNLMEEAKKQIDKLEQLSTVDSSLYGNYIEAVQSEVTNCKSKVDAIVPSSISLPSYGQKL